MHPRKIHLLDSSIHVHPVSSTKLTLVCIQSYLITGFRDASIFIHLLDYNMHLIIRFYVTSSCVMPNYMYNSLYAVIACNIYAHNWVT